MSNSLGTIFKITTFGESHGAVVGVVIDGVPAGFALDLQALQIELNRRKPGTSRLVSARQEQDCVEVLSGFYEGKTLGTPLTLLVKNTNQQSKDYDALKNVFRPSHADFGYFAKYGHVDHRGGGRASARETVGRVLAGAVAKQFLWHTCKIKIAAYVSSIHQLTGVIPVHQQPDWKFVESNPLRVAQIKMLPKALKLIAQIQKQGDSVGGIIEVRINGAAPGLGSPVFDKLEARIAHALMSIPAAKGVELGDGFAATQLKGSEHNDAPTAYQKKLQKMKFASNHAGGIVGGISTGQEIVARVAFKPVSSIARTQTTVNKNGKTQALKVLGRHDPCVLPRAVPIVEAMCACVIWDEVLRNHNSKSLST